MSRLKRLSEKSKEHLEEGEEIIVGVAGAYECEILGTDSTRNGVLLATNKRVVFFAKKLTGYEIEVFPYSTMSSIEMGKGLMGHKITLFASGNKSTMKWIKEGDVPKFLDTVRTRIGKKEEGQIPSSELDIPTQIKKLSELKDQGILTDEEFEAKKKDLFSKNVKRRKK